MSTMDEYEIRRTSQWESHEARAVVHLSGGNAISVSNGYRKTALIAPESLRLGWTWEPEVDAWVLDNLTVNGPVLNKDGTPNMRGRRKFRSYLTQDYAFNWDTPEQFIQLARELMPTSKVTGPIL